MVDGLKRDCDRKLTLSNIPAIYSISSWTDSPRYATRLDRLGRPDIADQFFVTLTR
jgi:hypothetical protein